MTLVTSAYCLEHPLYVATVEECGKSLRTVVLPQIRRKPTVQGTWSLAKLEFSYYRMFRICHRRLSRSMQLDYVFVPYFDYCLYAAALLGSPFGDTSWGVIAMRLSVELVQAGKREENSWVQQLKRRLFFRFARGDRSLQVLFSRSETLVGYLQQKVPEVAKRLRFLPDPAELSGSHSRDSARRMLSIPNDAVLVLVYGVLDHRKGIDALVAGLQQQGSPEEVALLVAGRQEAEVKTLLSSEQARSLREAGRLYEMDGFLSNEDEHAAFQAADIVWIGYREHLGSSGVLVQAAAAGLPVVACNEGLIGWSTRQYGLGMTVDIEDTPAVARIISELAQDPRLRAKNGESGKRFFRSHSVERFGRTIREELLQYLPRND